MERERVAIHHEGGGHVSDGSVLDVPYWPTGLTRIRRLAPPVTWQMAPQTAAIEAIADRRPALDVGAGGRVVAPDVITIDAVPYPGTRLVAEITQLPIRTGSAHGLICTGTLEHVEDPAAAVREFARVLSADGEAHVEVPFMQPYHADPHDYWRFTDEGLARLFRDWEVLGSGSHMGSGAGAAWVVRDAVANSMRRGLLRGIVYILVSILVQPLRLLDRGGRAGGVASGFWVRARPGAGEQGRRRSGVDAVAGPEHDSRAADGELVDGPSGETGRRR